MDAVVGLFFELIWYLVAVIFYSTGEFCLFILSLGRRRPRWCFIWTGDEGTAPDFWILLSISVGATFWIGAGVVIWYLTTGG